MRRGDYFAVIAPAGLHPANAQKAAEVAARHDLAQCFRAGDLLVFASAPSQPLGDTGALIGQACGVEPEHLSSLAAAARQSAGRALVTRCWGDYLVLCRDPAAQCVMAIRPPASTMPTLRATLGAVTLISSNIDLLLALGVAPRIDWDFVAQHLAFPHLRGHRTGIAGVDEVVGGECLTVRRETSSRLSIWSPWHFASADHRIDDREAATDSVRHAILSSVAELAAPFRTIMIELSGGLDSSIVAAALGAAGARCVAVNLRTPDAEGDERRYARAVAARTGHRLIEDAVDADLDLTGLAWSRTVRPGIPAMLKAADRRFLELAEREGCDAFFSGSGGDCVFAMPDAAAPVADRWLTAGGGLRFLRTAMAVAEVHDASLWRAVRRALRQAHQTPAPWPTASAFLRKEALPTRPDPHPWLSEPDGVLPGTRAHVRAIVATLGHLDGYARQSIAPSTYPLLSQPVIEACLHVPSWLWVDRGRDRAIARRAFRDLLPASVIDRRTKGAMDGYCMRNYDRNRERLTTFLERGHLATAGLLDRVHVAEFLDRPPLRSDPRFYDLLPIIDCEVWLRTWLGDPD